MSSLYGEISSGSESSDHPQPIQCSVFTDTANYVLWGGGLDDLGGYSPAGDTFSAALMEVSCVLVLCSY